ncbi:hypothetical protein F3Y22_tig00116975pilonHSYRG00163 [Hibiscus syriacus]|uniref:Reverse transcriptase zinc-binding domain-containing protein n=1 Tax=Hibiscus syriacus TaxID=106335 RepID=A0A6A2X7M2_HIBSY|nr:hypothetical protein F3Y22_tig00116975pilonHSYRG00163 [Hibiscus syriacus]
MPSTVASKLNKVIARFLWGAASGRAIHWVKWDQVYKPKEFGGLGVVDLKLKNRSLLNKWLWKFGEESSSLWRKVLEAKYGLDHSSMVLRPINSSKLFWVWRSISSPMGSVDDMFTQKTRCADGDGSYIDFWTNVPSFRVAFSRIYVVAIRMSGCCLTGNGVFGRSFISLIDAAVRDPGWNLVWTNLAPPKVEAVVWRFVLQRIPLLLELAKRGGVNL